MYKSAVVVGLVTIFVSAVCLTPQPVLAIEPGSLACKRELETMRKKMDESLDVLDRAKGAPAPAKCSGYSNASELANEIREIAARCQEPEVRTSAVRDADDVIDEIEKTYQRWCPPRPGLVRVKMTMVKRVTRDQLAKPLAVAHRCIDDGDMYSTNERFDLGRLIMLGCPGITDPTEEQARQRNTRVDLLKQEQAQVYVTRDADGDDPHRLSFPILTSDGREATTDTLVAGRVGIGQKLDLISSFWEPAKDGVCRVHAVWRVADGKPKLVLWQEVSDCSRGTGDLKTVLDRQ